MPTKMRKFEITMMVPAVRVVVAADENHAKRLARGGVEVLSDPKTRHMPPFIVSLEEKHG